MQHSHSSGTLPSLVADSLSRCGIGADDCVAIGLSGGLDSVVLLDLLCELPDSMRPNLQIAHLDHGIRSAAESESDLQVVRRSAKQRGLPLSIERIPHRRLARTATQSGSGLETVARRERYAFFDRLARSEGLQGIALAHHLDDQCETVLMRLLQGCGVAGLAGIPEHRRVVIDDRASYAILRPLLEATRSELVAWAASRSLRYHDDPTNSEPSSLRNRLRHLVMPMLHQIVPSYRRGLERTARLCASTHRFLQEESQRTLVWQPTEEGYTIDRATFFAAAPILRLQSLYRLFDRSVTGERQIPYQFLRLALQEDRPFASYRVLSGHGIDMAIKNYSVIWNRRVVKNEKVGYYMVVVESGVRCGGTVIFEAEGSALFALRCGEIMPPLVVHGQTDREWILEDRKGIIATGMIFNGNRTICRGDIHYVDVAERSAERRYKIAIDRITKYAKH